MTILQRCFPHSMNMATVGARYGDCFIRLRSPPRRWMSWFNPLAWLRQFAMGGF
jgi:hypothetical protein